MSKLQLSPDALARDVGDEIVLMDLGSGKYFRLNPVGAAIWRSIGTGADPERMGEYVSRQFCVDITTASTDVAHFLAEMKSMGLLLESD